VGRVKVVVEEAKPKPKPKPKPNPNQVGRWKAMVEEERTRHAAERARDGERAAAALEQELLTSRLISY
jgi:hypothetical protein